MGYVLIEKSICNVAISCSPWPKSAESFSPSRAKQELIVAPHL